MRWLNTHANMANTRGCEEWDQKASQNKRENPQHHTILAMAPA
jgi:hypothetical protein